MEPVLPLHAAATLYMAGVIWFAQVVHYPPFDKVGAAGFAAYSETHSRLTTLVVGPPMLVEAATTIALRLFRPDEVPAFLTWGLFCRRSCGSRPRYCRLRAVAWSVRGLLALRMLSAAMS